MNKVRGNLLKGEARFVDAPTASQQAKAQGFKSLAQVAELSTVKRRTLENWHKDKPELFNIVLLGCYAIQNNKVN